MLMCILLLPLIVALRKESVDRNLTFLLIWTLTTVALRKESVDRNTGSAWVSEFPTLSLSARRAWIEISDMSDAWHRFTVALRKESVDRNIPSNGTLRSTHVALRKESVDRNSEDWLNAGCLPRRSPQGERG